MRPVDEAIYAEVTRQKLLLMEMEPDRLRSIPECTSEDVLICEKSYLLTRWHHKTKEDHDLFVVQCKRYIFLGFGHMFAEGFVIDSDNCCRDAPNELLWDYR